MTFVTSLLFAVAGVDVPKVRPNILWISCEDTSPDLGCYGDTYAITPHIDRLASLGVRYTHVFTHAGVCAPSRSGIITGMYPCSIGTHFMRCQGVPPKEAICFPEYLRAAGYFCTNNVKTDYQFASPVSAWDANNNKADWRGRAPGQPFFCVINLTTSHESQIRQPAANFAKLRAKLAPIPPHDPAKAVLPPFYPDTPVVRQDWANYHDVVTAMDAQVGEILTRLRADGLEDDTIIWFWGDHGRGLPRCKRWLYDSGTRAPLLVVTPAKFRDWVRPAAPASAGPGIVSDELVAFVDFAPTVLSLAGIAIPPHLQGQAFLGPARSATPRSFVFGARDRMDETYDIIRSVRDRRYRYIRNFRPDLSRGQNIGYMDEMPTMQEMRRLHKAGQLQGAPAAYFDPEKPVEEFYDCQTDPQEIHNLAGRPEYADRIKKLRSELAAFMARVGDLALVPEIEFENAKRPGERWETAQPPRLSTHRDADGKQAWTLFCPTPGASIVFATKPNVWKLYPPGTPLGATKDEIAMVKSCRLGYHDSPATPMARLIADERHPPPELAPAMPPFWRDAFPPARLARLAALRESDHKDAAGLVDYASSLSDADPLARYWGAWGVAWRATDDKSKILYRPQMLPLLTDSSRAVRILAAETLGRWGDRDLAKQVLVAELGHPQMATRLAAITALRRLAFNDPDSLAIFTQAVSDPSEYVPRVAKQALADLRTRP